MSYHFSKRSQEKLATCHSDLQRLFNEVIKHYDCTIICGMRDKEAQMEAFEGGFSKAAWGASKHNISPSEAVDVAPFPVDWSDRERFFHFAGFVKATAFALGIDIVCGIDWDGDNDFGDQSFFDGCHFELV